MLDGLTSVRMRMIVELVVGVVGLYVEALEYGWRLSNAGLRYTDVGLSTLVLVHLHNRLLLILRLHLGERHLTHALRQVALRRRSWSLLVTLMLEAFLG